MRFRYKVHEDSEGANEYVLVLDAKSGRRLDVFAIGARNKYIEEIRRDGYGNQVHQTWLVYSGESRRNDMPGIEFNPQRDGWECWSSEDYAPGKYNFGFKLTDGGVIKDKPRNKESRVDGFVGHLRCNAVTIDKKDVFERFVDLQIAAAKHYFGLK